MTTDLSFLLPPINMITVQSIPNAQLNPLSGKPNKVNNQTIIGAGRIQPRPGIMGISISSINGSDAVSRLFLASWENCPMMLVDGFVSPPRDLASGQRFV